MTEAQETAAEIKLEEKGFIRETVHFVLIALAIALPIRFFIAQPFIVSGQSMTPTFENGDYLIVDQLSYRFEEPKRGDVIVFHNPNSTAQFYIKRIIGLPGERVSIDGTVVEIRNEAHPEGIALSEPYLGSKREDRREVALQADEYFVMGDNRGASFDSRNWGPLKKNFITGRALLRLWPVTQAEVLPGKADPLVENTQ